MKFVFSLPVLLTVLTGSSIAIASPLNTEPQTNLPTEITLEKQDTPSPAVSESVSFIRAFRNLLTPEVQAIESNLAMNGNASGFRFEVNIQSQTIFEQPNRFQSRV